MPGDQKRASNGDEQGAGSGDEQRAGSGAEPGTGDEQRAGSGDQPRMSETGSLKGRVTKQSEVAIGKLAQELLENSVVSSALAAAFGTRERALRAQEAALGALNIPSASDIERLTRRVRSVSQRLEGIEDGLDRVESRLERGGEIKALAERLDRIEAALERLQGVGVAGGPSTEPEG